MKHVCTRCGRTATDKNLLCPEENCPARTISVLGYGHQIGDLKITKSLRVMRMATLYEATRGKNMMLVKIAHQGCERQLRHEARWLRTVQSMRKSPSRLSKLFRSSSDPFPGIPTLLPAYEHASLADFPYGVTTLQGNDTFYEVLEHVDGVFLPDILSRMPHPWYPHAVWLTMAVADVISFMNKKFGILHLKIDPGVIMVRTDEAGTMRPMLMDFGVLAGTNQSISYDNILWLQHYGNTAYIPPELMDSLDNSTDFAPANDVQDVYGLGLLLFEMLAGKPKFDHRLSREVEIRKNIKKNISDTIVRNDIPNHEKLLGFVRQASHPSPQKRQPQNAQAFKQTLKHTLAFGDIPQKEAHPTRDRVWRTALTVAILLCLMVLLGAALPNLGS